MFESSSDPNHSMRFLEYVEAWGKLWDSSSIPQEDREGVSAGK